MLKITNSFKHLKIISGTLRTISISKFRTRTPPVLNFRVKNGDRFKIGLGLGSGLGSGLGLRIELGSKIGLWLQWY